MVRSHICFQRKRDPVFTRLNSPIGKAVNLFIVNYCVLQSLISRRSGQIIVSIICFYRHIYYIRNALLKRYFLREHKSFAGGFVGKSDDIRSCSMLRHSVITSICDNIANIISSPRKFVMNDIECFSVIVFGKIRNIFQKHDGRMFCVYDFADLEKHISTRIGKAVLFSANRKRLTREARYENVKSRNACFIDIANISFDERNVREIMTICHAGILVYIIRPNDRMSGFFESQIDSSYSAKQTANSHINA